MSESSKSPKRKSPERKSPAPIEIVCRAHFTNDYGAFVRENKATVLAYNPVAKTWESHVQLADLTAVNNGQSCTEITLGSSSAKLIDGAWVITVKGVDTPFTNKNGKTGVPAYQVARAIVNMHVKAHGLKVTEKTRVSTKRATLDTKAAALAAKEADLDKKAADIAAQAEYQAQLIARIAQLEAKERDLIASAPAPETREVTPPTGARE